MSRKQKKRPYDNSQREESAKETRDYDSSNRILAPPCECCKALRKAAGRDNHTRITGKSGDIRHLKCFVCGNTWKRTIQDLLRMRAERGSDTERGEIKSIKEKK